jgi:hypothetical protein
MDKRHSRAVACVLAASLVGCAGPLGDWQRVTLPAALRGKAELLPLDTDQHYAAAPWQAVSAPGKGATSAALVVRLKEDVPVYRAWSGTEPSEHPRQADRLGQWWSFDDPRGLTRESFRRAYGVCSAWNQLRKVATCRLLKGAVVAVGPPQSVDASTCGTAEAYPPNLAAWQVYIHRAWERKDLVCPPEQQDRDFGP